MNGLYDDGILTLYSLENVAEAGSMPKYALKKVDTFMFEERTIGVTRAYIAMGNNSQVDVLARVQAIGARPSIGMVAVLSNYRGQANADGDQFRIDLVQSLMDGQGLFVYDLTLQRLGEAYDVVTG